MTIPPFPSQDLAKLVLGYLAEEQLMTAYDEFLQASPYLDALGNEYDRIFMTSLKNILAEYRAVKIHVETCKPFILRKKIFQCTNLLEIVKFLIQNVDINKLQIQENNSTRNSFEKQNSLASLKSNCEVCSSLKLDSCTCKGKNNVTGVPCKTQISISSAENSVETTPLSDLPGNHVTHRKKNAKILNQDYSDFNTPSDINEYNTKLATSNEILQKTLSSNSHENLPQTNMYPDTPQNPSFPEKPESLEMRQKEEFNSILNQVCNKNKSVDQISSQFEDNDKQNKTSFTGYNDFATGVNSVGGNASVSVPDSSTSELHVHLPTAKETNKITSIERSAKVTQTKTQYLLKVANVKNNVPMQPSEVVSINTINTSRVKNKSDDSKIKIISDIKVDKSLSEALGTSMPKMPAVLKNATSTPLLQMQTIVINGTPVYRHNPFGQKDNYTKDEIMAMPTIILAPVPGSSQITESQGSQSDTSSSHDAPAYSSTARKLGALLIDVSSSNNSCNNKNTVKQNEHEPICSPVEEVKDKTAEIEQNDTVIKCDITSASAPKDTTVTGTTVTSTPQVLPPLRKSSSTPRRTSHVRVLDFTTPRRILHETINKCVPHLTLDSDKEVVLSKSPDPATLNLEKTIEKNTLDEVKYSKENSAKKVIKNWDADLRALATIPETTGMPKPKSKPKPKKTKQKTQIVKIAEETKEDKSGNKRKQSKVKSSKNKSTEEDVEVITIPDEKGDIPLKPTINIIALDRNANTSSEGNKSQNKSNNDDNIDTPEMERISLGNEIGVKLNISDLLETPYKQALYDIQMETPRFLGPDIPDDPMSDIKIMNIPTPRFLNAATPSSYSSRPTDYSSGGSYYKPEDQDYMRVHDEVDCLVTSTKETLNNETTSNVDRDDKEKENMKPTRPVRECTKNVSYNLTSIANRTKTADLRSDFDTSVDSPDEKTIEKVLSTPKLKENKSKPDTSKKTATKKRRISVQKETSKSAVKEKPKRPTPIKNNVKGKRKSNDPKTLSKVQTRKKSIAKEGSVSATPVVNSAPTKSRRKSSTPRKLHCSKTFHSESSGHDSPEFVSKSKENTLEPIVVHALDSDTEQLPLRWSDDGSQEPQPVLLSIPNESEDIKKIREYIETSVESETPASTTDDFHIDLVKTGFDIQSAKSIERDLLSSPKLSQGEGVLSKIVTIKTGVVVATDSVKVDVVELEKTLESDCSTSNNLQIVQNEDEEEDEEVELSIHECNEDTRNYFSYNYDESKCLPNTELAKLKDKFSMEVCIDDDVSIRLRATSFSSLLDQDPQEVEHLNYSYRETEIAVNSISNFDKLYTPLKESVKAQCYEIFDSTLTSLDTPLKVRSPKKTETEVSVTEIVLEVEKIEDKEKPDTKKRKRMQSGNSSDDGVTENKRPKPEAQLLFNSTNIQNFDIDSVLCKLHGH